MKADDISPETRRKNTVLTIHKKIYAHKKTIFADQDRYAPYNNKLRETHCNPRTDLKNRILKAILSSRDQMQRQYSPRNSSNQAVVRPDSIRRRTSTIPNGNISPPIKTLIEGKLNQVFSPKQRPSSLSPRKKSPHRLKKIVVSNKIPSCSQTKLKLACTLHEIAEIQPWSSQMEVEDFCFPHDK